MRARPHDTPRWSRRSVTLLPFRAGAFAFACGLSGSAAVSTTRVLDFAGTAGTPPDPSEWNHELGGDGWNNNEVETYTAATANASVDGDGHLVVTARRQSATGADRITRDYTSARLTTAGKVHVQPGSYVETTIQAPIAAGMWPAFWLVGDDVDRVGWPACGELDVFETLGTESNGSRSTIHLATLADPTVAASYAGTRTRRSSTGDGAHRYGVLFSGSRVRFYLDRDLQFELTAATAAANGWAWPFGRSMFLLLNVAVGGTSGDPSRSAFPRAMTVGPITIWSGGTPF